MSSENSSSAISASQNSGAEISTSAVPIAVRSQMLRGFSAEMMPTDRPATTQIKAAPTASDTVAGIRSLISVTTDCCE